MFRLSHISALAITALLTVGCSSRRADSPISTINIIDNIDAADTGNGKELFETVWSFQPAMTDSTILTYPWMGGIDGNQVYLYENEKQNRMLVFDATDGRCISSFDKTGEGPEDYASIWWAWKSVGSSGWTVQDASTRRLVVYTADGKFEKSISNDSIEEILPCGDGWVAVNSPLINKEMVIYRYSADWKPLGPIDTHIEHYVLDNGNHIVPYPTYVCGDCPYIFQNDTLCIVTGDRFEQSVIFNTGKYHLPRFTSAKERREQRGKYINIFLSQVNDRHALVGFFYSDTAYYQVYRLSDGELLFSKSFPSTYEGTSGFPLTVDGYDVPGYPETYADKDAFYFIVHSEDMGVVTDNDDCNPAIVKVRIKD